MSEDTLTIAGVSFNSRLITGTGKHRSQEDLRNSVRASGTEIITVAIGRLNLEDPNEETILDALNWDEYTILPNTAGAKTADQAVGIAKLAREVTGSQWIKLEVIPNPSHLLPDPVGTFDAAKTLIAEGFTVLPYIHADPVLAAKLQDIGCATVMPLGSPIGSGRGVLTAEEIAIIVEQAEVPVVVDAGTRRPLRCRYRYGNGRRCCVGKHRHCKGRRPRKDGRSIQTRSRRRSNGIPSRENTDLRTNRQQPANNTQCRKLTKPTATLSQAGCQFSAW